MHIASRHTGAQTQEQEQCVCVFEYALHSPRLAGVKVLL